MNSVKARFRMCVEDAFDGFAAAFEAYNIYFYDFLFFCDNIWYVIYYFLK